ncbi:hypothetical protein RclHR1_24190003 [Rhizophagus clarus]|uniref:Uncharacterized protein n=1 Tax=Rhizophagus clarus TaxID=94130 RepID=A0A2Z6QX35_9GLOM|nr:hypothetical protein RclHR1_24190003 [Rhizophagus clarus]
MNHREPQTSGPRVFGLDIGKLHQCRLKVSATPTTSKKRPLFVIQTKSGQNKRFAAFGKESEQELSSLIAKHHMTTETGQPIVHVRKIELDFNGETINLSYQHDSDEPKKLDAIVRACDESLLVRDGYRRIGTFNIDNNIDDFDISEQPEEGILVEETEIGNGAYRSIQTLLKVLISIWKNASPPILNQGDTIHLKFGGDGRNVGRKQKHVMMTLCLLNEKKEVLKPDHQYFFCLYVRCEKYENLEKIGQLFQHQLFDLKNNGIIDQDSINWAIELFFCGDWKIMYIIMGLKKFPVLQFVSGARGEDIEKLWREFNRLYIILHKADLSDQEIDQFEIDAQNWVCMFCRPTQGHMNSSIQIPGLYRKEDIMPYMHVFAKHIPQFMRQLKEKGLSLLIFFYIKYREKESQPVPIQILY